MRAVRCCAAHATHRASGVNEPSERPHHSDVASITLAAGREKSGVQDCVSCTPVAGLNSTDVLYFPTSDLSVVGHISAPSSSNRTVAVPRTRTSFGDRNFAVTGPQL